jgi:hypothetical protein
MQRVKRTTFASRTVSLRFAGDASVSIPSPPFPSAPPARVRRPRHHGRNRRLEAARLLIPRFRFGDGRARARPRAPPALMRPPPLSRSSAYGSNGHTLSARPAAVRTAAAGDIRHVFYQPSRATPDGRALLVLTPPEFLAALARLIPPPRVRQHRYHGVLAPNAGLRDQVRSLATAAEPDRPRQRRSGDGEHATTAQSAARSRWARLIARAPPQSAQRLRGDLPRTGRGLSGFVLSEGSGPTRRAGGSRLSMKRSPPADTERLDHFARKVTSGSTCAARRTGT